MLYTNSIQLEQNSTFELPHSHTETTFPSPIESIHQQAIFAAHQYRKSESRLIQALENIEKHKVHLHYGHASLFQYAIHELQLAENTAYILITVMRKAKEVPALKNEINAGNISISNARRIAPIITTDNQSIWIKKATELSQRQLEKEIAKAHPLQAVTERAHYIHEQRLKLELGISETHLIKVRRAQDLISKARSKHTSIEETLIEMTEFYLHHKDPQLKAKRVIAKKGNSVPERTRLESSPSPRRPQSIPQLTPQPSAVPSETASAASFEILSTASTPASTAVSSTSSARSSKSSLPRTRTPIPSTVLHQVHFRDQGRCTYLRPDGNPCKQARWTEIHHVIPLSQGGKNNIENLTTLCSAHHRWIHRQKK
jgi:hypothetical protein